jgi:hypothetical protein
MKKNIKKREKVEKNEKDTSMDLKYPKYNLEVIRQINSKK